MNNKCINFKVRTKKGIKYFYCTKRKQIITYSDCKNCVYKEYKQYKTLNKRTYKQNKKEKGRFSIIYPDLSKCCVCGSNVGINQHECRYGKNRSNSIIYGLIVPLCQDHHTGNDGIHQNKELDLYFHRLAQMYFEKNHTRDEFIQIFKENYLK